jgi:outer membrane protein assembly factor BamB
MTARSRWLLVWSLIAAFGTAVSAAGADNAADVLARSAPNGQTARGDWPMDRGGPSHTGTNPAERALSPATVRRLQPAWQLRQCSVQTEPVVVGDTMVINDSCSQGLFAVDTATGEVRWETPEPRFGGTAAVDASRGIVFVSSEPAHDPNPPAPGGVDAYALSDGHRMWFSPRWAGQSVSVTVDRGQVLVPLQDGHVISLDEDTGDLRWRLRVGGVVDTPITVAHGRVFFVDSLGSVYGVSESTGAVLWRHRASSSGGSTPAAAHGLVSFGTWTGNVVAVSASTGHVVWRRDTGLNLPVSSPAISGNALVVTLRGGRILELNALTGERRLRVAVAADYMAAPVIANRVIYTAEVGGGENRLYALSLATGKPLLALGGESDNAPMLVAPVVAHGALYVGEANEDYDEGFIVRYVIPPIAATDASIDHQD